MAEFITVILPHELISYPGSGNPSPKDAEVYTHLTNGQISDAWANPVKPVPVWVRAMALEVAARAARNPKGLSSWTRSLDDGSRTERLPDSAARAGVYLTDSERAQLAGRGRRRRRIGTIRTLPGY